MHHTDLVSQHWIHIYRHAGSVCRPVAVMVSVLLCAGFADVCDMCAGGLLRALSMSPCVTEAPGSL